MVLGKTWTLPKHFDGPVKESDLVLVEKELPSIKSGEVLVQGVYWSVDPYMRPYMRRFPEGSPMIGEQICKVVESQNPDFAVGSQWLMHGGWRSHSIVSDTSSLRPLPALDDLPLSYALGTVGMPGATAYFGLMKICQPKAGQVVLVNGAAGAVGSVVGQLAKVQGCTVVAYCGDDTKVKWLKEELGFDHVFNYKTCDLEKTMTEAAPDGFDCFFDNVGAEFTSVALSHMKDFGRIAVCGSISTYNATDATQPKGPYPFWMFVAKQLYMEGFIVMRWAAEWPEAFKKIVSWIKEGKIKCKETITDGFDKMPHAFMGLFTGANTGKAIVKA